MPRPGLLLYFDILPALDGLPLPTVGELLLAALHYAQDGVEPVFEDNALTFAWAFIKPTVDRDGAAYETKRLRGEWLAYCKQCKRDGTESLDYDTWCEQTVIGTQRTDNAALPTTTTSHLQPIPSTSSDKSEGADKPPPRPRFVPPSVEEVGAYCMERRNGIDPAAFVDYYQARGWKYNSGQVMKDWQAAIRTWEKRERPDRSGRTVKASAPADFQPSFERIQKSNEWLDQFLASQGQGAEQ